MWIMLFRISTPWPCLEISMFLRLGIMGMLLSMMLGLVCGGLIVRFEELGACADCVGLVDIGAGWDTKPMN